MIRKAKALIVKSFKLNFAYKFAFWTWTIILTLLFLLNYFVWNAIFAYSGVTEIRGFTLNQTILYYGLSMIVSALIYVDIWNFQWLVRSGAVLVRLVRPISYYPLRQFLNFIGEKILVLLLQVIPLTILIWTILKPKFSALQLSAGVLSIFLAMVLNFLFWWGVAQAAVWLIKVHGLYMAVDGIFWFISGGVVPLAFFPKIVQKILALLPFQYTIYVPIQIFLGKLGPIEIVHALTIQLFWICALLIITKLIWLRALRALEAVGV